MANRIIDQETYDISRQWAEDMIMTVDNVLDFDQEAPGQILDDDQITEACIELQFALEKYYRVVHGYDIEAHPMVEVKAFDRQPISYKIIPDPMDNTDVDIWTRTMIEGITRVFGQQPKEFAPEITDEDRAKVTKDLADVLEQFYHTFI
jgi:hypothetical protein